VGLRWAARRLADVLSRRRLPAARVAASGLTGGAALHTTVMPFILRGVRPCWAWDSVLLPIGPRRKLWQLLEDSLRPRHLGGDHHRRGTSRMWRVCIDQVREGAFLRAGLWCGFAGGF